MDVLRSGPSGALAIVGTVIVGGLFTVGTMMVSAAQCSIVSGTVIAGGIAVSYIVKHLSLISVWLCEGVAAALRGSFRRRGAENWGEPLSTPDDNASTEPLHLFGN